MAEKRPTGEEMRQKMKEEFKQDLRKRKEFLDSVKEYKRTKTLSDAVVDISNAATQDDTDVWIEKVNEKSAITEAKMEVAMDSSIDVEVVPPKQQVTAATEAEMRKIQAAELVRQMKAEMEAEAAKNAPKPEVAAPKEEVQTPKQENPAPEVPTDSATPAAEDVPPRKLLDGI